MSKFKEGDVCVVVGDHEGEGNNLIEIIPNGHLVVIFGDGMLIDEIELESGIIYGNVGDYSKTDLQKIGRI